MPAFFSLLKLNLSLSLSLSPSSSLNLNTTPQDSYFTIHVTPQTGCSYVSFETDFPMKDYTTLINKVLSIFRPRFFSLNVFSNDMAICGRAEHAYDESKIRGFVSRDRQIYSLNQYTVAFGHYARDGPDSGLASCPPSPELTSPDHHQHHQHASEPEAMDVVVKSDEE